jgi:hypothetical protein
MNLKGRLNILPMFGNTSEAQAFGGDAPGNPAQENPTAVETTSQAPVP